MNDEVARFRFEPRNRLPCDVKFLFKTHKFFYDVSRQVNVCSAHSALPWSPRLANAVEGVRGSYYRMDVRWPTEQLKFVAKVLSAGSLRKYQANEQVVSLCVLL